MITLIVFNDPDQIPSGSPLQFLLLLLAALDAAVIIAAFAVAGTIGYAMKQGRSLQGFSRLMARHLDHDLILMALALAALPIVAVLGWFADPTGGRRTWFIIAFLLLAPVCLHLAHRISAAVANICHRLSRR